MIALDVTPEEAAVLKLRQIDKGGFLRYVHWVYNIDDRLADVWADEDTYCDLWADYLEYRAEQEAEA